MIIGSTLGQGFPDSERVIAGMLPGFRECHIRWLAENPETGGSFTMTLKIGPDGEVVSANARRPANVPDSIASCLEARARASKFAPPEGGAAVVAFPVMLAPE